MAFRRFPAAGAAIVLFVSVLAVPAVPSYASGPVSVAAAPRTPAFAPGWSKNALDRDAPDPDVVRFGSTYPRSTD